MGLENTKAQERSDNSVERAPRSNILVKAKCRRQDGTEYQVTVRNASATGMLGGYQEVMDFVVGETVSLGFRNLTPISAQVVWCEHGQVGFSFASSVNVERLLRGNALSAVPQQSPRAETMQDWIARARREREQTLAMRKVSNPRPV